MTRMLRMTRALTKLWFESKWACQKKQGVNDTIVSPLVVFLTCFSERVFPSIRRTQLLGLAYENIFIMVNNIIYTN